MRISDPSLAQKQAPQPMEQAPAPHKNRFSASRMAGSQPVWQPKAPVQAHFSPQTAPAATFSGVEDSQRLGFADFLDVINPLQHIPVVATLYRKATGDTIRPAAQFMGGALFGGPLGAASAMVDVAVRERTGRGFGENVAALAFDRDRAFKPLNIQIAQGPSQTASQAIPGAMEPAAGRTYTFGALPRTAGLMPVAGETRFAAMLESLHSA